jgi:threonine synthase
MYAQSIRCFNCRKIYPIDSILFECVECGGPLDIDYDYDEIERTLIKDEFKRQTIRHWKYWRFYPIKNTENAIVFGEGGTPLIQSRNGKGNWFFKYEGMNPTGSFKDRGSAVEITKAKELGVKEVWCATTGNMGASVAAYSARARIKANIAVPAHVPESKIKQILAYGANVRKIRGTYDDAVRFTKKLRQTKGVYLTGDYPYRGEGEKSTGFEIIDQLNFQVPDYVVVPVGNGTNIYGIYKGIMEFKAVGLINKLPKIIGVQSKGCDPVYKAWINGSDRIEPVKNPKTIANAIEVGNPMDGIKALRAVKKTEGSFEVVTDSEIRKAQIEMGREGIYAESAGATGYAAAKKLGLDGTTVIVVSGHGLKEK